ncbi:MAG: hypothetical protein LBN29_06305 [Mediterranea sp.]|jgi:hypothetical protein|nr:hypothetical protein [Mediterranea sp.]
MTNLGFEASFPLIPIETKTVDGEATRYRFENVFTKKGSPNRYYQVTVWVPNDPADNSYATRKKQEVTDALFTDEPELISQSTMRRGDATFAHYMLKNKADEQIHCCIGSSGNRVYTLQVVTRPGEGTNYDSLVFLRAFDLIREEPATVAFNPDSLSYSIDFPYPPYMGVENVEIGKIISVVAMPPQNIPDKMDEEREYQIIAVDSIPDMSQLILPDRGNIVVWRDSIYGYVVSEMSFKAELEVIVKEWEVNNGEAFYSDLIQGVLSEQGGELVGQERVKAGDLHGIAFHIKNLDQGRSYICRAFLARRHLYQIMVTGGTYVTPDTPAVARFMDSFRLK